MLLYTEYLRAAHSEPDWQKRSICGFYSSKQEACRFFPSAQFWGTLIDDTSEQDVPNIEIPFLFATLAGTAADWNYSTVAQVGLDNRTFHYNRGHVVGGSSSISTFNGTSILGV